MKQPLSAEVLAFFSAAGHKGGTKRMKSITKAERQAMGRKGGTNRWAGTTKKQRHEEALVRTRKAAITRAKNKKEKS